MPQKVRLLLLGSALLLSFHPASPAWGQSASSLKGTVVSLTGSVQFRNGETVLWQDCQMGQEVSKGDHIRTEADGKVTIKFTNGNVMALKENSAMIIEELQLDPATGKYDAAFRAIK